MSNPVIVKAYIRRYTREQIEAALDSALRDHASGIQITSTSFEGGSTGGAISGKPTIVIEEMLACLEALDSGSTEPQPRQQFVPVDFFTASPSQVTRF